MNKITIIGAGLTGLLLAILLGKRGYQVKVYEKNDDPRTGYIASGKTICLTLSKRGLDVLKKAGVYDEIMALSTPIYGRYLHLNHNEWDIQPYGNHQEALYSISREALNISLINAALKFSSVSISFNKKYIDCDLNTLMITLESNKQKQEIVPFELLIGADGVYSKVRRQMQDHVSLNHSEYTNKEVIIPAKNAEKAHLLKNYIHLWPRDEFMLIAFPNQDGSFIGTLQLPSDNHPISFDQIDTEEKLIFHFKHLFPDAIKLIPNLVNDFFRKTEIPMVTVRCPLWRVRNSVVLIGDAAHGIWPSYGQGVNAGFEDCDVLDACLIQFPSDRFKALEKFQAIRKENTDAIAKLSEVHFKELKTFVADPHFLLRKKIERQVNLFFPSVYFSTYSRVSFTSMPYSEAVLLDKEYRQIIDKLLACPEIVSDLESPRTEKLIRKIVKQFREKQMILD